MGRSRERSRSRRRSASRGRRQGDSRRERPSDNDDSEWQEWRDPGSGKRSESRGRKNKDVRESNARRREGSREKLSPIRRLRKARSASRGRSASVKRQDSRRVARSPSHRRKRSPSRKPSPSRKKRSLSRKKRSPSRKKRSPSRKKRSPSRKKRSLSRKKRSASRRPLREVQRKRSPSRPVMRRRDPSRSKGREPSPAKRREASRSRSIRERKNQSPSRRNQMCERSRSRSAAPPPPPEKEFAPPPPPDRESAPPLPDAPPLPESPPRLSFYESPKVTQTEKFSQPTTATAQDSRQVDKPANLISFAMSAPPSGSSPDPVNPPEKVSPPEEPPELVVTNGSLSSIAQPPRMMAPDSLLVKMFLESHKKISGESEPPRSQEPPRMQEPQTRQDSAESRQERSIQDTSSHKPSIPPQLAEQARLAILQANKPQSQQTFEAPLHNQQTSQQAMQQMFQNASQLAPPQLAQQLLAQQANKPQLQQQFEAPTNNQQPQLQSKPLPSHMAKPHVPKLGAFFALQQAQQASQQPQQQTSQFGQQSQPQQAPQFPPQQQQFGQQPPQHAPQFGQQFSQQQTPQFGQQFSQQQAPQFDQQLTQQQAPQFGQQFIQQHQFPPTHASQFGQQSPPQQAPQFGQQSAQLAPQVSHQSPPSQVASPQQTPQEAPAPASNSSSSSSQPQLSIDELRTQLVQVEKYIEEENARQQTLVSEARMSGGESAVKALMQELAPRVDYLHSMKEQIQVSLREKMRVQEQPSGLAVQDSAAQWQSPSSTVCKASSAAPPLDFAKASAPVEFGKAAGFAKASAHVEFAKASQMAPPHMAPPAESPPMMQSPPTPNGALPKQSAIAGMTQMPQLSEYPPSAAPLLGAAFAKGSSPPPPEVPPPVQYSTLLETGLRGTYAGTFSHPEFGNREMPITVQLYNAKEGQWTAEGQTEAISVLYQGDNFMMAETSGMTKLAGQELPDGSLKGVVIQEGRKGGTFLLNRTQAPPVENPKPPNQVAQVIRPPIRNASPPDNSQQGAAQNYENKWDQEKKWDNDKQWDSEKKWENWKDDNKQQGKRFGDETTWNSWKDENKQENKWDDEKKTSWDQPDDPPGLESKWDDDKKWNNEKKWDDERRDDDEEDEKKWDDDKKWDDWDNGWDEDEDDDGEWESRRWNDKDEDEEDKDEDEEEEEAKEDDDQENKEEEKEEKRELQEDEMEVEVDDDPDEWWTPEGAARKGKRKGKGKGKGKGKKKGKGGRRISPEEMPEMFDDDHWEEPREKNGLVLLGEKAPENSKWDYILKDETRRSYAAFLPNQLTKEQSDKFFEDIKNGTDWKQPEGARGLVPRKTAWMVKKGCSCEYRYGSSEVEPEEYPPWMLELLKTVMPMCGLSNLEEWPDSCNLNLYEDGQHSVGWHADDERIFQGKFTDIAIISISFGQARKFQLRLNFPDEDERDMYNLVLGNGDIMTMEGMTQKHYQHRVPKEDKENEPRINLTWRWILRHSAKCPQARSRAVADREQYDRERQNMKRSPKRDRPQERRRGDIELCGDFKNGNCSRGAACKYSHGEDRSSRGDDDWARNMEKTMLGVFGDMSGFVRLKVNPNGTVCFVKFEDHDKAGEARNKGRETGRRVEFAKRELDNDGEEEGGICTLACFLDKGDKGWGSSGRIAGTFVRSRDTFGFIKMDDGEEIFCLPRDCVGYDGVLPILGSRVSLSIGQDQKTGKPKADEVYPEGKGPPSGKGGSKSSKGGGKDSREERRQDQRRRQANDWDCPNPRCTNVVFGSRSECPRCQTPKPAEDSAERDDSNPNNIPVGKRDSSRQDDDEESSRPWKRDRDSSPPGLRTNKDSEEKVLPWKNGKNEWN